MEKNPLPTLITFDGEARSGKGTIVQATKDYLRDNKNLKVMLIDAGQVFRVLVVAATRAGIDLEDPDAIDRFLSDDKNAEAAVRLVKEVYNMSKEQRDSLLYTNEVGENSAKVGARPLSQEFKDMLLTKWMRDARSEGFQIVLLDGRALEEVGSRLASENLCEFPVGLYFICDAKVGARRTLGFATKQYDELSVDEKESVDKLINQIDVRNQADRVRAVQPLVRPDTEVSKLPNISSPSMITGRPMYLVDTSADMSKQEMSEPIIELVAKHL